MRVAIALVALLAIAAACSTPDTPSTADDALTDDPCPVDRNTQHVSAKCIDPWPVEPQQGTVRCDRDAVTFDDGAGVWWALNGVAQQAGFPDVDPIWLDSDTGAKVSLSPLIAAGRELC